MIMAILRAYSAIFRYTGLIMALLSLLASAAIGIGIVRDGYILVNGHPSRDFASIATAVGTPLLGLAIGLALFFLTPKVRPLDGKDDEATRQN